MNRRAESMRREGRWVTALAACAAMGLAGSAMAQDTAVKPEVMLLIDTSGSMQSVASGEADGCAGAPDDLPILGNDAPLSRMTLIKQALAGTPKPTSQSACVSEPLADPGFPERALGADVSAVNRRQMCCDDIVAGTCRDWKPCGADGAGPVVDDIEDAIRRDGLIHQNEARIKFGLMTYDGDPRANDGQSFGTENNRNAMPGAEWQQAGILGQGVRAPNVGARGPAANAAGLEAGDLIPGSRGVLNDGVRHPETPVGEDEDSVRRHNALVADQVRSLLAGGPSPLAALLHDAGVYYDEARNGGAPLRDDAFECRRRVAVLVTDGGSSKYYEDPDAPEGCQDACDIDGFPYETSEAYAAELAARGVPLYVIGFGGDADEDKARSIARAAAVRAGRADETGYFFLADDREALSQAFGRISNQLLSGLLARTRPLVVSPGEGDVAFDESLEDVRQVRLASFTEVSDDESADRYGRIEARRYACEAQGEGGASLAQDGDAIDFDAVLAGQDGRNAVGSDSGGGVVQVVGGDGALFDADGNLNPGGLLDPDGVRDLLDSPLGEDGDDGRLDDAVDVVEGFFGEAGIGQGGAGPRGRRERQLGEIYDGDLVSFPPPSLVAENPSWQAYVSERRLRPTLIAAGARDGQIHFFRLADGQELFTFVPRLSFRDLSDGADSPGTGTLNADGPLATGEVARCRSLGDGDLDCPGDDGAIEFHSLLVGGLGSGGANLFGVDITEATDLLRQESAYGQIDGDDLRAWDVINDDSINLDLFGQRQRDEPLLGLTVSRPLLTHVRVRDQVRGAVIVGCGEDRAAGGALDVLRNEGRCVLVLDAVTGETIRRFSRLSGVAGGAVMDAPMVGSPVGWPSGGIQPSTRAFIGDRLGRLWRIDMRAPDPADWEMRVAWPPTEVAEVRGYRTGRPVIDRPSITVRDNGRLVVVFGTGDDPRPADEREGDFPPAHVVSFTEAVALTADTVDFQTQANWVLPLRASEYLTGAPVTFRGVTYFSTVEAGAGACANPLGRLYGVHSYLQAEDPYRTADGRDLDVQPALPTLVTGQGLVSDALAIRLPTARVAYGLAVTTLPSCGADDGATAQIVLNLADGVVDADGQMAGMRAERPTGQVVDSDLDGSMFDADGTQLALDLDGTDGAGNPLGYGGIGTGPFAGWRVLYWGSTFAR